MGAALDHSYRYRFESAMGQAAGKPALSLATSGGVEENPFFFRGRLLAPELSASLLSTLSRVVGSRFYVPPAMLARILALADPVVTCGGGMLRFEGFSSCASAYARVDFTPEAHAGEVVSSGTTNVDFNAKMRAALASIRDRDGMELSVGREEVRVTKGDDTVIERKVALPVRWLKGFVEVQAYTSRMHSFAQLAAVDALRFVRALPRSASPAGAMAAAPGTERASRSHPDEGRSARRRRGALAGARAAVAPLQAPHGVRRAGRSGQRVAARFRHGALFPRDLR